MRANHYAESFERFAATLPEPEGQQRRALFESFLASGFPDKSVEDFHYTDLSALAEQAFEWSDAAAASAPSVQLDDADLVVPGDPQSAGRSKLAARWDTASLSAMTASSGIEALNAAFATDGLQLELAREARPARPLHVLLRNPAAGTMLHQRHRITLGERAEATVLLHFAGTGDARLATHRIDVRLAAGARLHLYRLCEEGAGASLITRIDVRQARDSGLSAITVDLGGGLARHDVNVDLAEPGAEAEVSGLYMPRMGAHVDNHTKVVHSAAHCRSRSHYRGIIDEHAKAVFNGKVIVQPGAQKTDSEQRIGNLLLSRKAEINAKPELEIYADDVKCAHGSTVGQLDETALAYLRSRGIPRDVARALLLRAFAVDILDRIEWPSLRAHIETRLHRLSDLPEVIAA